jgi:hypothetical protein
LKRLRALWAGDLPLSEAFWVYAVSIGVTLNAVTTLLFFALIVAERPLAALFFGYGCAVPYNVVATVGVWRSAARHEGERALAELARLITLVGMILLSLI